jgi:hypothetical protein
VFAVILSVLSGIANTAVLVTVMAALNGKVRFETAVVLAIAVIASIVSRAASRSLVTAVSQRATRRCSRRGTGDRERLYRSGDLVRWRSDGEEWIRNSSLSLYETPNAEEEWVL